MQDIKVTGNEQQVNMSLNEINNIYKTNNQNHIVLLGDFNTKIGAGDHVLPSGDPKLAPNKKRLINLTNDVNLKIINKSPKCKSKWTIINTKNVKKKSIIDYALCTQALYANINIMIIYEEENYKLNGKNKTDHISIIIEINKSTSALKKKIDNDQ